MTLTDPILLKPLYFETRWGDRSLSDDFGFEFPGSPETLGEVWLLSDHPKGVSPVLNQPGFEDLASLMAVHEEFILGGRSGGTFPLIVKLLMIGGRLSVQVHPDGEWARRNKRADRGKHEAWVVLNSRPEAFIVRGLSTDLSREVATEAIEEGRFQDYLKSRDISPGSIHDIPPGTFHAAGDGVLLLEVQERCDVTLRVYDWGRREKPLEIEGALSAAEEATQEQAEGAVLTAPKRQRPFEMESAQVQVGSRIMVGARQSPEVIVIIKGTAQIEGKGEILNLGPGSTVLWPAELEAGELRATDSLDLLRAFPIHR